MDSAERVPLAAVESRLLREVDDVLPGSDQLPGESDLPRLAYTEAVVNEALRLFPPAHLTSRVVPPGETLTVGGYTIPGGTAVYLPMYLAHRDPAVWPRAEEFLPERFLPVSAFGVREKSARRGLVSPCSGLQHAIRWKQRSGARTACLHAYGYITHITCLRPGGTPVQP